MRKKVTIDELITHLKNLPIPGPARIATLVLRTRPQLNNKHRETGELLEARYPGGVERFTARNVVLGASYGRVVNKQREYEGVEGYFTPQELWSGAGEHDTTYTVRHKGTGKRYMVFKPHQGKDSFGVWGTLRDRWVCCSTGVEVVDPSRELSGWLPRITPSQSQGVENERVWRTVAVENVLEVHCGGEFEVVGGGTGLNVSTLSEEDRQWLCQCGASKRRGTRPPT